MHSLQYVKKLKKARKDNRRLLKRIHKAHEAGDKNTLRGLVDLYLKKSTSAKLCALHEAYKRKRDMKDRPDFNRLIELAHSLNLTSRCREPVLVVNQSKKNGGIRKTLNFGPIHTARQIMIAEILKQVFDFPSYMTNAPGNGGRNTAVKHTVDQIRGGMEYLVIADIANCFGSFSAGEIVDSLPLPRKVIETTILSSGLNIVGDDVKPSHRRGLYLRHNNNNTHTHPLRARPAGLPQGSVASPLISLMLLSKRTEAMPYLDQLVLYGDDICVSAANRKEAYAIRKTLQSSFNEHPAGRLEFRKLNFHTTRVGVEFLGYKISGNQSFTKVVPLPETIKTFKIKMKEAFNKDREAKHDRLVHTRKYADDWLNGFSSPQAVAIAEKELHKYSRLLTRPPHLKVVKKPFTSPYNVPCLVP